MDALLAANYRKRKSVFSDISGLTSELRHILGLGWTLSAISQVSGWTFVRSDFWNSNLRAQAEGPLYPSELEFIVEEDRMSKGPVVKVGHQKPHSEGDLEPPNLESPSDYQWAARGRSSLARGRLAGLKVG